MRVIKLSNGTGYSLQAPDGKMVNVSFPRAGGIRLEEFRYGRWSKFR